MTTLKREHATRKCLASCELAQGRRADRLIADGRPHPYRTRQLSAPS